MARTGNNTNAWQWLYVKVNVPVVWRWKIGITGNLQRRTRQTSADVFGWYVPIAFIWMPFAWSVEQFMLSTTKGLQRSVLGQGGKEIRPWYVGITAAIAVYVMGLVKWSLPFWAALFLAWLVVNLNK